MSILLKPYMPKGSTYLQEDHYWRAQVICFRHLAGAWAQYQKQEPHRWIVGLTNADPLYGRQDYLNSRSEYMIAESEEYTQSMAATLFAQVWILSAANYHRLDFEEKNKLGKNTSKIVPFKPKYPKDIAEKFGMDSKLITAAEKLNLARNTIAHLAEKKVSYPLGDLGFRQAYEFAHCTWEMFVELRKYYNQPVDEEHWTIQTEIHRLPSSIENL